MFYDPFLHPFNFHHVLQLPYVYTHIHTLAASSTTLQDLH